MFLKVALWIVGGLLIIFWLGTLFENRGDRLFVDIDKNTGFLGLSILLAGWLVAISQNSEVSNRILASHYLEFIKAIGTHELTLEQLAKEAGKENGTQLDGKGVYQIVPALSDSQQRSLTSLIYEGKICLTNEQYSLPKNT